MKQILQNLKNGSTQIVEIPCPQKSPNEVLISTSVSLISPGTEKMIIDFGKANYINKALQQPEKVKMVYQKIKTDGLNSTYNAVKNKLEQPIPIGYCNVGTVINGDNTPFKKNERIVSNGFHAEIVTVPKNLCARIPDNVDDDTASFTVLGAIALQGVRLAKPNIGEIVVVIGLGVIGLLTIQILNANGCKVIGIDHNAERCELAKLYGIDVINLSKTLDPLKITNF